MPTYDYQCRSCSRVIEVIHSMTEDGPSACEVCGGALRRVLFPAGIIFKGSGFYRNDSRASSEPSAASPKKPESGSTGGDGSKGSTGSTESAGSTGSTGSTPSAATKSPEGSGSSD